MSFQYMKIEESLDNDEMHPGYWPACVPSLAEILTLIFVACIFVSE
jgi:hypothetical protein